MTYARVVSFDDVNAEQMDRLRHEIEEGERPDDVPAQEVMILHDPGSQSALAILLFETQEDYDRGDEVLNAMPAEETVGKRTGVAKYEVALRATA